MSALSLTLIVTVVHSLQWCAHQRRRDFVEHVTNTWRLRLDESGCARTVNGLFWITMTEQGDPVTRRQAYNRRPARRRRNKLAPDPDVRRAIIVAASKSVRENGIRGLSVCRGPRSRPAQNPCVLPTFRIEGPVGCGGLLGDD